MTNHDAPVRKTILLGTRMPKQLADALGVRYDVLGPLGPPFPAAVAAMPPAEAARVEALITMGTADTTRAALACLPALRLVGCFGSGYEGVDLGAARERGIAVTHSPGANSASVADMAMALLLASVRRLVDSSNYLRRGDWEKKVQRNLGGPGLTGRRMGVYGLGAIGEKIALRGAAFEMEIGYHNRRPRADVPYAYFGSLRELAAWSDVLMVAVRADSTNRRAVDADVLHALGPDGHIVNISRGSAIDESALIAALEQGRIAGAGLDVFEGEPAVPAALIALPNATLTPHIGGDTEEAMAAMSALVMANLEAYFAGRAVLTPVP